MGSRTPAKSRKRLLKEPATPTKKIADLISRKEEGEDVVKGIISMKKEIEGKLHLLSLDREEETVNVLYLMLSQVQMAVLCAAIIHVPENFLERN